MQSGAVRSDYLELAVTFADASAEHECATVRGPAEPGRRQARDMGELLCVVTVGSDRVEGLVSIGGRLPDVGDHAVPYFGDVRVAARGQQQHDAHESPTAPRHGRHHAPLVRDPVSTLRAGPRRDSGTRSAHQPDDADR